MAQPARLLLIEDNAADIKLIEHQFEHHLLQVDCTRVYDCADLQAVMAGQKFDVILADYALPGYSFESVLDIIRAQDAAVPIILVSGYIGEDQAIALLSCGIADFVLKDHLGRLVPAIERCLADNAERAARQETEARLFQAQKMEAIGKLTGGMAHDFNNILGVMIGNLELALADLNAQGARDLIGAAIDAGWHGAALTQSLLAVARRQPLRARFVQINPLVAELGKMLDRSLGANLTVKLALGEGVWPVWIDAAQFEATLLNLATNARDAMPEGGVLTITTRNCNITETDHPPVPLQPGDYVCISVRDTGIGMDPAIVPRIFEPFFTTKEQGKGTGLGLAMVYGFVLQSGGQVDVETGPAGSCFALYLPRTTVAPEGTTAVAAPSRLSTPGRTILLLEGNPRLLQVFTLQLKALHYRVVSAANIAEATEALARETPDLLMSDTVVPGEIDGVGVALRLAARHPRLPILLVSGCAEMPSVVTTLDRPTIGFLQKPFSHAMLARALEELFAAGAAEAGIAPPSE